MAQTMKDARKEVRALIQARGLLNYEIWTAYAAKIDAQVNVKGRARYQHVMCLEGDANVKSYVLHDRLERQKREADAGKGLPDAVCVMRNSQVEWHFVRCVAENDEDEADARSAEQDCAVRAKRSGAVFRLITTDYLNRNATLISNWREGLSYLETAKAFDLAPYKHDVLAVTREQASTSVEHILASYMPDTEPLLIAALFQLIQDGVLESDLAKHPFGLDTTVKVTP